jgi:uncharacterized protein (TIGR02594 family)
MSAKETPAWITYALNQVGVREIPGPKHEPKILGWWKKIFRGGIKDDETPWCAAFVGACLEQAGIQSTRFESAKSYESWGVALAAPVYGCIVVFTRAGGGHVAFVVGEDKAGNLLCLGGNQGNCVSVKTFERGRVSAYRWPSGMPAPVGQRLPILASVDFSTSEA